MGSAACSETVFEVVPIAQITIIGVSGSVEPDRVRQLTANLRAEDGQFLTGRTVSWSTTNAAVAAISPNGRLTTGVPSTATIRAASEGRTGTLPLTVEPSDWCEYLLPYSIGTTVSGRLETSDCQLGGDDSYVDYYAIEIPSPQGVTFRMSSDQVDPFLLMSDASDDGLGFNDDSAGSLNATLRMLLASGSYQLWANADDEETGDYTLLSLPGPSNVTGCIDIWIMAGLEATQSLTANDCLTDGFYSDQYLIWLTAGARVTISMDSGEMDTYLRILDISGNVRRQDDDSGPSTNARLVFNAPSTSAYVIDARTFSQNVLGSYTLTVQ